MTIDTETYEKRRGIVMDELMGDEARVRCDGYKGMARCVIGARHATPYEMEQSPGSGEWRVALRWKGAGQSSNLNVVRRLDVKTALGWRTVWDDGTDDLWEWERDSVRLPTCKAWRSGTI